MRRTGVASLTCLMAAAFGVFGAAPADAAASCAGFMDAFTKAAPGLKAEFVRPVLVRRGPSDAGSEARDLVSEYSVDARLFCRGDRFLRFEAQTPGAADARLREGYYLIQEAATMAAFKWPRERAQKTIHALTAEAADYLRASRERGDVFVAGKTERRNGRDGDIAVFWSESERTFIIVGPSD